MPTALHDLPALVVHEIVGGDGALIHGTFTHLRRVRLCRSWLNTGAADPLIGDLVALDEHTRVATFEASFWSPSHAVQVGSVAPWLDGQWQPWYVTMILDPDAIWTPRVFPAQSDGDHEHCLFCMAEIGRADGPVGYQDANEQWLCVTCAERYALRAISGSSGAIGDSGGPDARADRLELQPRRNGARARNRPGPAGSHHQISLISLVISDRPKLASRLLLGSP